MIKRLSGCLHTFLLAFGMNAYWSSRNSVSAALRWWFSRGLMSLYLVWEGVMWCKMSQVQGARSSVGLQRLHKLDNTQRYTPGHEP